jgi:hypothetical protein
MKKNLSPRFTRELCAHENVFVREFASLSENRMLDTTIATCRRIPDRGVDLRQNYSDFEGLPLTFTATKFAVLYSTVTLSPY